MKLLVTASAACAAVFAFAMFAAGVPVVASAQTQTPAPARPRAVVPLSTSETIAALVNDGIVTTYDLSQRMRLLIMVQGIQLPEEDFAQFQSEALISLIDERLQLQELRRVELEQKTEIITTEEEVDAEISNMAQQINMTREQFVSILNDSGVGAETLRQQIQAENSWARWIRGRYGSRLRIGDDQIDATLVRMQAAVANPQYQIGEVLLDSARYGGPEQTLQGARQLVSQMQQGTPFPAVARQFSALTTAATGGDAGWVSQGEMPPEVEKALEQMRPGQLSLPIPVRGGVYIIYLRDKRAGGGSVLVNLKQIAVALPPSASADDEAAARAKLETLRPQVTSCGVLEGVAASVEGVVAGDLGEAKLSDLAPQFRETAEALQVDEISGPIRTNAGLHLVAVCGRKAGGNDEISRDEVENRLFGQHLSMIARRYMRDLRTSATIETR